MIRSSQPCTSSPKGAIAGAIRDVIVSFRCSLRSMLTGLL
jgi:hypothetical protein